MELFYLFAEEFNGIIVLRHSLQCAYDRGNPIIDYNNHTV